MTLQNDPKTGDDLREKIVRIMTLQNDPKTGDDLREKIVRMERDSKSESETLILILGVFGESLPIRLRDQVFGLLWSIRRLIDLLMSGEKIGDPESLETISETLETLSDFLKSQRQSRLIYAMELIRLTEKISESLSRLSRSVLFVWSEDLTISDRLFDTIEDLERVKTLISLTVSLDSLTMEDPESDPESDHNGAKHNDQ